MVFSLPASLDCFRQIAVPGLRTSACYQIFSNMTRYWLRCLFVPRHCSSAFLKASAWNLNVIYLVNLYRDTRKGPKICNKMSKTTPYPPRTVTASWLKNNPSVRMLRRVTLTNHIAGPLAKIP